MSYARFGEDSDVYVFLCVSGAFECCGCRLQPERWARFDSTNAIVVHLRKHIAAGHAVPDRAIPRLLENKDRNDAYITGDEIHSASREERDDVG